MQRQITTLGPRRQMVPGAESFIRAEKRQALPMKISKVYLVGAGPGDPGLMTVRGLHLLRGAEVVVYDQLVNPVLLEEAQAEAQIIFVGKQVGRHSISQNEINEILINYALQGYGVVRLKGGDPFVFGRGGEEAEALADAGVPFEIAPGVSSAVAVPAYAGIPLTHRKFASSFAVITGHEASKAQSSVDWARLATAVDTLVILMGLHNLPAMVAKLIAHGRPVTTPAAVIRQGTIAEQETVIGTLENIVEKSAMLKAPALIVVGEVVRLSAKLNWFVADLQRCNKEIAPHRDSTLGLSVHDCSGMRPPRVDPTGDARKRIGPYFAGSGCRNPALLFSTATTRCGIRNRFAM
jgi:uroporphyrin-III C-methyltransferase